MKRLHLASKSTRPKGQADTFCLFHWVCGREGTSEINLTWYLCNSSLFFVFNQINWRTIYQNVRQCFNSKLRASESIWVKMRLQWKFRHTFDCILNLPYLNNGECPRYRVMLNDRKYFELHYVIFRWIFITLSAALMCNKIRFAFIAHATSEITSSQQFLSTMPTA